MRSSQSQLDPDSVHRASSLGRLAWDAGFDQRVYRLRGRVGGRDLWEALGGARAGGDRRVLAVGSGFAQPLARARAVDRPSRGVHLDRAASSCALADRLRTVQDGVPRSRCWVPRGGAGGSGIVILRFLTSGNTYSTSTGDVLSNVQAGSRFEETDTRKIYYSSKVHTFLLADTGTSFTPSASGIVEYLVVGGGGGAAYDREIFKILMGEDVVPRKDFINKNAINVINLDI